MSNVESILELLKQCNNALDRIKSAETELRIWLEKNDGAPKSRPVQNSSHKYPGGSKKKGKGA
jgi:hypothetical protein